MAGFTIDTGLQSTLDRASRPFREEVVQSMHTYSPILDILAKKSKMKKPDNMDKPDLGTDGSFNGFETFWGTDVEEPVYIGTAKTAAKMAADKKKIWITDGVDVNPENTDTTSVWATWIAANIGAAMSLTLTEQQKMQQFQKNKDITGIVNLLDLKWKTWAEEIKYQLADAIYNGQGPSATPYPEIIGLGKMFDTSYEYGLSAADYAAFPNWAPFYYDLENLGGSIASFLGYTNKTQLDTIGELMSASTITGRTHTPVIVDIIRRMIQRLRTYNRGVAPDLVTVRRTMLEMIRDALGDQDQAALLAGSNSKSAAELADMGYPDSLDIGGGVVVVADDTGILRKESKSMVFGASDGVIDFHYLDDYKFKVNDMNNFKVTGWKDVPGKYNVMQNIITATLVFYNKRRDRACRIKLPDAFSSIVA